MKKIRDQHFNHDEDLSKTNSCPPHCLIEMKLFGVRELKGVLTVCSTVSGGTVTCHKSLNFYPLHHSDLFTDALVYAVK